MEIIEIKCPRSIDLKGISSLESKAYEDAKAILQTIDIYDIVRIHQEIKLETGIVISSKTELLEEIKEKIQKIVTVFSEYANLEIKNLIIDIEKEPSYLLETDFSIYAGVLIGLNEFFKTKLSFHELMFLGNQIDPLVSYYLEDGYKKFDLSGKLKNIGNNPYTKYFLIESIESSKGEIEKMQEFRKKYANIDYKEVNDNLSFIAIKDIIPSAIPISLKKNFPKTRIIACRNSKEHKVLKYLK